MFIKNKVLIALSVVIFSCFVLPSSAQAAQITVYATANSMKWMATNKGWNTNPDGVSGTYYSNPQNDANNTFIVDLNGKTFVDADTDIVVDKIQDSTNGSLSVNSARTITVLNGGIYYSGTGTSGMIIPSANLTINGTVTNAGVSGRAIVSNGGALTINAGVGNTAVINQSTGYAVQHGSTGQLTIIGKVNGRSTGSAVLATTTSKVVFYNPGNDVFSDAGAVTGGRQLQNTSGTVIAVGNMNGSSTNGSNIEMIRNDGGTFELLGNVIITGSAVRGVWNRRGGVAHVYGNIDLSGVASGTSYGFYNQSTATNSTITGNLINPGGSPTAVAAFSSAGMVTIYGTKSGSGTVNSATFTTMAATYVSVSPTTFPASATGHLNASITGIGTTWNGGESVTITDNVSGSTSMSAGMGAWTITDGTHGTLPLQNGSSSSVGIFTINVGAVSSGPLAVLPASFILSQTTGSTSNSYNLTLTGISTRWAMDIAKGNHTTSNLFSASTGGTISNVSVSNDNTATLTLTTDSVQRLVTITDNSNNITTTFNTNNIITYDLNPSAGIANNYIMIENGMTWDGGGRWMSTAPTSGGATPLGAIRFVGKFNKLEGYITNSQQKVVLNIDGVDTYTYTVPSGGANVWQTMFTGLDDTAVHTYVLVWNAAQVGGATVGKIRTTGGTGINTDELVPRPVLACYGDSITQGGAFEVPGESTLYFCWLLAKKLNYQAVNMGLSGTTVSSYAHGGFNPTTKDGVGRTADITNLPIPASVVMVHYGTNDVTFNTNQGGTPTEANFQADYSSMLAGLRSGNLGALIIAERLMLTGRPDDSLRNIWSQTDIAAAVAVQSDSKIVYMHGGYDNYNGSDGVHSGPVANMAIANGMYSDIISAISSTNSIQVSPVTLSSRSNTAATVTSSGGVYGTAPYTYQWFRSTTSGWSGFQVTGATGTTLNDTGLTPGTTYYYTLQTTDSNGLSALSNQIQASPASNDAALSNLTLSQGALSPEFSSDGISYTASVANSVTSLTVTPTVNQADATITINGTPATSGSASASLPLSIGSNAITVIVTAQDGITTKTYTISVTREVSTDATLSSLIISSGTLSPSFSSGTTSYTGSVGHGITSLTVTPTVNQADATVTVNGMLVISDSASEPIALNIGANTITVTVTAQDETTTDTYTITVARAGSDDATLSNLAISQGTLSPSFSSGTTSYTGSVGHGITSLTITPIVHQADATITINGTTVTSGNASGEIVLNVGTNTINVIITAQDGITTETYTILVTRSGSSGSRNKQSNTIWALSGANGSVSPSGSISVSYGGSQTYTIAPFEGYQVADVFIDGISEGPITTYTFNNILTNHTISATFFALPSSSVTPPNTETPENTGEIGNTESGGIVRNTTIGESFIFASEDSSIITKLQELYGVTVVTEDIYHNQCETKQGKTYYRTCALGLNFPTFDLFRDSVLCEGFIVEQTNEADYRLQDVASRKEITGIAVKMKKVLGEHVSFVQVQDYLNLYQDIGLTSQASWIQPVVETALKYGIISRERLLFEPDRDVTRAEAYAIMMNSVCMAPDSTATETDWRISTYNRAKQERLTMRIWETFEPDRPILRQELFLLASKAADWAERTGGCDPKPEYCFLTSK